MPLINKNNVRLIFALVDFSTAMLAWSGLFFFRKFFIEGQEFNTEFAYLVDENFKLGIAIIPLFWVFIYFFSGTYTYVYQKSRLTEMARTFVQTIAGVIILFFTFLLDEIVNNDYKNYY
jgi:hypothetical protein